MDFFIFLLGLLLGGVGGITATSLMIGYTNDQLLKENKDLLDQLYQKESTIDIINQNSKILSESISKTDELIRLTKEYSYIFCSITKRKG